MKSRYPEKQLRTTLEQVRAGSCYDGSRLLSSILHILGIIGTAFSTFMLMMDAEEQSIAPLMIGALIIGALIISSTVARAIFDAADCSLQSRQDRLNDEMQHHHEQWKQSQKQ